MAEADGEIRNLIGRYAQAVDRGRFTDTAACFATDGVLDVVDGNRSVGRDAIAERFSEAAQRLAASAERAFVRHHVSSIVVDMESASRATSRSYFLVLTEVGLDHWGSYKDTVVLTNELDGAGPQWRFAERRVTVEGRTTASRMT